jgi:hypothetical protein
MITVYQSHVRNEISRLLSFLDRESISPCYGCFDRLHWAWSGKNLSNIDLQKFTLPLAYVYMLDQPDNLYFQNAQLLQWIEAAIVYCCKEQSRNGAFDQWLPNDNSIVCAGFTMHDLVLVDRLLGDHLSVDTKEKLQNTAIKSARLLTKYKEKHGVNSNHSLANAAALLEISHRYEITETSKFRDRAINIIEEVIGNQTENGGFFEYSGIDLGYHTLGLSFLASCYKFYPDEKVFNSLCKAVSFSSHFLNRVSGNGGSYGSRGTHLLYPFGFEVMASYGVQPELKNTVLEIISNDLCVTPNNTDLTNLIPLLSDYVRVCLLKETPNLVYHEKSHSDVLVIPHKKEFFCEETTLYSIQKDAFLIHGRLNGGMMMVNSLVDDRIIFSSFGYTAKSDSLKGYSGVLKGTWTKSGNTLEFKSKVQKSNRMRLTLIKSLILQSYFFLFGNFMPLNLLIKRVMAWLLIFKNNYLNILIGRNFVIEKEFIVINDSFHNKTSERVEFQHCSEGYIHFMGSARYFDNSLLKLNSVARVRLIDESGSKKILKLTDSFAVNPGGKCSIEIRVPLALSNKEYRSYSIPQEFEV